MSNDDQCFHKSLACAQFVRSKMLVDFMGSEDQINTRMGGAFITDILQV